MEEKTANMAENIRVTFTGFHYIKDGASSQVHSDRQGAALSMRTM